MTSQFSLQARWLLPVDRPPIEGGVVTITHGRITGVGTQATGPVEDLGHVALLPGFVNAHTHLEFSHLDQPLGQPGISLPEWIRLVISSRQQARRNSSQAIAAGQQESRRQGVTLIGNIATESVQTNHNVTSPAILSFQEAIGFSAARSDSVLADIKQRLGANDQPSKSWGISPHAPYTVHPLLLQRLVELASSEKIGVAMHLAESPEELEFLRNGSGPFQQLLEERSMWDHTAIPPNSKPLDYLKTLSHAPRTLVVHGNYLTNEEIDYLAQQRNRMSVTYCPRTHAYFAHAPYPLQSMLDRGIRVALGTDSRASNPDLSILAEMRHVAQHHPQVAPKQILRMGTLAGAEALALDHRTGSITPGKSADLTAVPCEGQGADPFATILADTTLPTKTWIAGHPT